LAAERAGNSRGGWATGRRAGNQRHAAGLADALNSNFLAWIGRGVFALDGRSIFLARYSLLLEEHGSFMVGIDYVDSEHRFAVAVVEIAGA